MCYAHAGKQWNKYISIAIYHCADAVYTPIWHNCSLQSTLCNEIKWALLRTFGILCFNHLWGWNSVVKEAADLWPLSIIGASFSGPHHMLLAEQDWKCFLAWLLACLTCPNGYWLRKINQRPFKCLPKGHLSANHPK